MVKIEPQGNGAVTIVCPDDGIGRKVKVAKNGQGYVYTLGGGTSVLPLPMGNGYYHIEMHEPLPGMKYKRVCAATVFNESDAISVFLRPNVIVKYTPDSVCASTAKSLFDKSMVRSENIRLIAEHIKGKLTYDYDRAKNIKQSASYCTYSPDADEVYRIGRGICYDYAVVFAAMLRSVGIPCRVVFGRVGADAIYHAWNEAYVDGEWVRYDITFEDEGKTSHGAYRPGMFF